MINDAQPSHWTPKPALLVKLLWPFYTIGFRAFQNCHLLVLALGGQPLMLEKFTLKFFDKIALYSFQAIVQGFSLLQL